MDKARKRALERVAAQRASAKDRPGGGTSPTAGPREEVPEPMSLAQSRRKRAMRIAKRAAIEAARANSVGMAAIESAQDGRLGESGATPEAVLLGDAVMWQHLLEQIYERIRPASLNSTGLM